MSASALLDRLDRPKQTRPGSWVAGCPCCQSKRGRPVSVRELDDGRVLLHAFCGCSTESVLAATGLTLNDLFPERLPGAGPERSHRGAQRGAHISARDLLRVVSEEVTIVAFAAADLLENRALNPTEWTRLVTAAARIQRARDHLND